MEHPLIFFEVVGNDGAGLRSFYGELFGWRVNEMPAPMDYRMVASEDARIEGGIDARPNGGAGHTTFYVESDDPETTPKRAEDLGASTLIASTELRGGGVIALLADPEGHPVGAVQAGPGLVAMSALIEPVLGASAERSPLAGDGHSRRWLGAVHGRS